MDESEFNVLAEKALKCIERALEQSDIELDWDVKPGGVLEVEFENGSKIIINRHSAAKEIWVAARSGGFHFRREGEEWRSMRDGITLYACLSELVSELSGQKSQLLFEES